MILVNNFLLSRDNKTSQHQKYKVSNCPASMDTQNKLAQPNKLGCANRFFNFRLMTKIKVVDYYLANWINGSFNPNIWNHVYTTNKLCTTITG